MRPTRAPNGPGLEQNPFGYLYCEEKVPLEPQAAVTKPEPGLNIHCVPHNCAKKAAASVLLTGLPPSCSQLTRFLSTPSPVPTSARVAPALYGIWLPWGRLRRWPRLSPQKILPKFQVNRTTRHNARRAQASTQKPGWAERGQPSNVSVIKVPLTYYRYQYWSSGRVARGISC